MTTKVEKLSTIRRLAASGEARRIRRAARLTIDEVAHAVGVHHTTAGRWEKGERTPRGDAALRYGVLLDRLTASVALDEREAS